MGNRDYSPTKLPRAHSAGLYFVLHAWNSTLYRLFI